MKFMWNLDSLCPTLRQTHWDEPAMWSKPTTAHISYAGMVWADLDGFTRVTWGLTTEFLTGLNQVHDQQQSMIIQTCSLTVLYSFKIHSKVYRDRSLKAGVFEAELTGPVPLWHKSVLTRVFLPLAAGEDSHLHSERRYSYPESITKVRKGLKSSQILVLSSICLSSINNTHIKAVVQEQIRKVEFFA